jgi:hypothetical protein
MGGKRASSQPELDKGDIEQESPEDRWKRRTWLGQSEPYMYGPALDELLLRVWRSDVAQLTEDWWEKTKILIWQFSKAYTCRNCPVAI